MEVNISLLYMVLSKLTLNITLHCTFFFEIIFCLIRTSLLIELCVTYMFIGISEHGPLFYIPRNSLRFLPCMPTDSTVPLKIKKEKGFYVSNDESKNSKELYFIVPSANK
jgi:hypothetical protein